MRGFIGFADVERRPVGIGIHGDGADAHFAQGANDAQRDLAAIGYQNFLKHRSDCNDKGRFWDANGGRAAL